MIESAAQLFIADGYAATTVEQVASEAGVAVQTVYYTFGTKGQLLSEAVEFTAAGTHDPAPVSERGWMAEALGASSSARALAIAVDHGSDIYNRAAPLWPTVNAAAATDLAVARYWEGVSKGRREGMRRLVAHLSDLGALAGELDVDAGTDIMFAINSHATFQALVVEAGWTLSTFKRWLYSVLAQQLLTVDEAESVAIDGITFFD